MIRKRHPPAGARPGTLAIAADAPTPKITLTDYTASELAERVIHDAAELEGVDQAETVSWIDVQGLGDEAILRRIEGYFSIHPLALEDVVNVPGRPKAELYDDHLLIIARMLVVDGDELATEQVSFVLGERWLVTFQERYGDVFDPVRARLRSGKGLARRSGPDYLAYALLDAIVDAFFPVAESLAEELEELEEVLLGEPDPEVLRDLIRIKRQLLGLRRALGPQREAVNALIRDPNDFVSDTVRVYLRDIYDHCVQIVETIDASREMVSSLLGLYLSAIGQRTNDVMKVLTVLASIFGPLTFLAGIYGMNFKHMPELEMTWTYPLLLGLMVTIAAVMLLFFRRKGWLGGSGWDDADEER